MKNQTGEMNKSNIHAYKRFLPHQFFRLLGKSNITEVKLGDHVEKEMTVLFSDIRNFTPLSEQLTPRENFDFINSYFRQMEPVIDRYQGIIDKYIGDAIMALFPTNADDAVSASIDMLKQLAIYNQNRQKAGYIPIDIGIGLNTGYLMLGTIGSENHMESTVIGDTVNLSSRLESLTKYYRAKLLISEHTYHSLQQKSNFCIRFIDRIKVKGKRQPISIYEVYDHDSRRERKKRHANLFEEALAHYHYQQIPQAQGLLKKYLAAVPDDQPARIYLKRCQNFSQTGVHESDSQINKKVIWSSEYEINHTEIDSQHKKLVTITYELIDAVNKNEKQHRIDEIINFLNDYVINHFQTEERHMQATDYPFLENQKRQHQKFVKDFTHLKDELNDLANANKLYVMFRIQILVIDWVLNHTLKADKHFGKYLALLKREK